jgi:hypothetical protein
MHGPEYEKNKNVEISMQVLHKHLLSRFALTGGGPIHKVKKVPTGNST